MKTRIHLIMAVGVLAFMFVGNATAQNKKDLLLMIENQNTAINNLNQQVGVLTAQREQLNEQISDLKKQMDELKALVAASSESKLVNTGWTKRDDYYSGLARIQDDNTNKYGFIDKTGKVVIPCEWKDARDFGDCVENMARVENDNGLYGLIDKAGRVVIPCRWKFIGDYYQDLDLISVQDANDLYGLIDKAGKVVIPCRWNTTGDYYKDWGLLVVRDANGLWGFIDKAGKVVIPCKYEGLYGKENGKLKVRIERERHTYELLIDRTGREYKSTLLY